MRITAISSHKSTQWYMDLLKKWITTTQSKEKKKKQNPPKSYSTSKSSYQHNPSKISNIILNFHNQPHTFVAPTLRIKGMYMCHCLTSTYVLTS